MLYYIFDAVVSSSSSSSMQSRRKKSHKIKENAAHYGVYSVLISGIKDEEKGRDLAVCSSPAGSRIRGWVCGLFGEVTTHYNCTSSTLYVITVEELSYWKACVSLHIRHFQYDQNHSAGWLFVQLALLFWLRTRRRSERADVCNMILASLIN